MSEQLDNIHPGDVLRADFLEPLNITAYRLAKDIGVTPARIGDILLRRRGVTADTALRLSRYFGTSARLWLNLQAAYDLEEAARENADTYARIAAAPHKPRISRFGGRAMPRLLCLLLLSLAALPPAPAAPPARSPAAQKSLDRAFQTAADENNLSRAALLLKRGAHINYEDSDGMTALDSAVYWDNAEMVRLLLARGASFKRRQILFHAAPKMANLLIAHGADVNEKADDGETALINAANADAEGGAVSDVQTIKLLLQHGADVNAKTKTGETALMRAADGGFFKTVKILLDAGANVNARTVNGRTALMRAANADVFSYERDDFDNSTDYPKTVRLLLARGANPNLKDKTGKTALDMARSRHNRAFVNVLQAARKANAANDGRPVKLRAFCRKQRKLAV